MPPKCPSCGRFLSNDFVQGLLAEPAPCPRCGTELTADLFHGSEALVHAPEPLAESVRPPDLPPEEVRPPEERDPLEDWDRVPAGASPVDAGGGAMSRAVPTTPYQIGAIVVAGVVGGLIGGLVTRGSRSGTVVGTLVGAAAGALGTGLRDVGSV